MSDLVRMVHPKLGVRYVPRVVVKKMLQNGWASAPLDPPTSDEPEDSEPPDTSG